MKKSSFVKLGFFSLVIVSFVLISQTGKRGSADFTKHRVKAWDFTLLDMQERPIKLSDYRGKVLFVNFWASWDYHWRGEVPIFKELYNKYRDRGFEIISISLDDGSTNDLKPVLDQMHVNYKVVMGNETVSADYRIRRIPATYIIDHNGIIRKYYEGIGTRASLEASIKSLLKERDGGS